MLIETIQVTSPSGGEPIIINLSDYNPELHDVVEEDEGRAAAFLASKVELEVAVEPGEVSENLEAASKRIVELTQQVADLSGGDVGGQTALSIAQGEVENLKKQVGILQDGNASAIELNRLSTEVERLADENKFLRETAKGELVVQRDLAYEAEVNLRQLLDDSGIVHNHIEGAQSLESSSGNKLGSKEG